jgi:hypothetical protein
MLDGVAVAGTRRGRDRGRRERAPDVRRRLVGRAHRVRESRAERVLEEGNAIWERLHPYGDLGVLAGAQERPAHDGLRADLRGEALVRHGCARDAEVPRLDRVHQHRREPGGDQRVGRVTGVLERHHDDEPRAWETGERGGERCRGW